MNGAILAALLQKRKEVGVDRKGDISPEVRGTKRDIPPLGRPNSQNELMTLCDSSRYPHGECGWEITMRLVSLAVLQDLEYEFIG